MPRVYYSSLCTTYKENRLTSECSIVLYRFFFLIRIIFSAIKGKSFTLRVVILLRIKRNFIRFDSPRNSAFNAIISYEDSKMRRVMNFIKLHLILLLVTQFAK